MRNLTVRTLLPYMLLMLLAIAAPYLVAWWQTPAGHTFTGALVNGDDVSVYLSALRQGAEGFWLFRFNFSPEPIAPRLIYPFYLLSGRVAGALPGSFVLWFHLLRLAAGVLAMVALLWWVRLIFPGQRRLQLTAWLLAAFGAGLGWLAAILFQLPLRALPDLANAGWGLLQPLLATPHFAMGVALEVLFFICLQRTVRAGERWRWAAGGAAAGLALGLVFPYLIPVVGLVSGLYLLAEALAARRIPWAVWLPAGLMLLPLVVLFYYFGVAARQDANWEYTHITMNVIDSPSLPILLVVLGIPGVLAVAGLRYWRESGQDWLVPIWAVANVLALYVPTPFAGRFALGLFVPVSTLAAFGLEQVVLPRLQGTRFFGRFSRWTPTPYATLRRTFLLLTFPSTLLIVAYLIQSPQLRRDYPLYISNADVAALEWLAAHGEEDALIFADYPAGNYLPRLSNQHVFVGQPFLTIDLFDKLELVETFWRADTPMQWREGLIREWGIDYVYYGVVEQMVAGDGVAIPGRPVYEADGVTIYRVGEP